MPRRRPTLLPAALLVLLSLPGCGTRPGPIAAPASGVSSKPGRAGNAGTAAVGFEKTPQPAAITVSAKKSVLKITPEAFTITADSPGLQLLVTEQQGDGTTRDLTSRVEWRVDHPEIAVFEPGGYLRPLAAGKVVVSVSVPDTNLKRGSEGTIEPRQDRPWSFADDIVPTLTRLGCNTGSCHGKADGQNGFHLSLFGYDPAGDFQALARDGAQRRVSRVDPERSLFLGKATGRIAHGGGPRLAAGSAEYRTLLEWLKAGAPEHRGKSHGAVVGVSVEPASAMLSEPGAQQLRVVARHADGHLRDVTRQALFKTNDDAGATVNSQGRAELRGRTEADLIVRYRSHVVSARLATIVNPELKFDFANLPRRSFIDEDLFKRLALLKVPPSPPASDSAFLRRVSLDLTGEQPTPEQIRRFLADADRDKRTKLVDQLMAQPEFVQFWLIKLGDLLQISPARQGNGAYRYQAWVDKCLAKNTPWDVVVTKLLTALGDPTDIDNGGPVNYAADALEPTVAAEQTAQRFLGLRMRCAQCHDHPFDVWTQDDYFGLAAFFAKVQRGGYGAGPGAMMGAKPSISVNPKGEVAHLRTKKPAAPRLLDGKAVVVADKDDPRAALAKWMTAPDNPYFARSMANWAWAQLFGKGLVDPPDDMSRANPPVHPELLEALGKHFIASKYNLRDLIRTIAISEAYGLSSGTVKGNERDSRLFSHHTPRPLTAHQMADALAQATDVPNTYGQLGQRLAIRVTDPATPSAILDTFGRCSRTTGCAPVPTPPLSLRQALLVIGGDVIESKVGSLNGYLASALKLELEPEELIENLYLRTICRRPAPEELSRWSAELKQASSLREAAEDLFWSLLNSREFAFNH